MNSSKCSECKGTELCQTCEGERVIRHSTGLTNDLEFYTYCPVCRGSGICQACVGLPILHIEGYNNKTLCKLTLDFSIQRQTVRDYTRWGKDRKFDYCEDCLIRYKRLVRFVNEWFT